MQWVFKEVRIHFNQKRSNLFERASLPTPSLYEWVCMRFSLLFNIIQLLEIYDYNKNNNQIVWMTKWNPSEMHTTWISSSNLLSSSYSTTLLSTTIAKLHFLTQCVLWFVCIRLQDASSICYAAAATATLHTIQTLKILSSLNHHSLVHNLEILSFFKCFSWKCVYKRNREWVCVCAFHSTYTTHNWFHIFMGVHNIEKDYHTSAYAIAYCVCYHSSNKIMEKEIFIFK